MKISIVIPVYKVEKYLHQCVDSVLNQTYRDIEVILVDDGSPDACPQICDEYAAKDHRVVVIHKENGGLSEARNAGVKVASGDFGLFLDSDDYWNDPGAVQKLVDRHTVMPVEVLNFGYYSEDEKSGKRTAKLVSKEWMPFNALFQADQINFLRSRGFYISSAWNKLIAVDLLKELPFEKGKVSEDIEWSARLLSKAQSFDYIGVCFYCYRQRSSSITHNISEKNCNDLKDAILECYRLFQKAREEKKQILGQYTAYQLSTFIAVQAFSPTVPKQCVNELGKVKKVLQYDQSSLKVRIMRHGVQLLGLTCWCKLIRATKWIWNSRRDWL